MSFSRNKAGVWPVLDYSIQTILSIIWCCRIQLQGCIMDMCEIPMTKQVVQNVASNLTWRDPVENTSSLEPPEEPITVGVSSHFVQVPGGTFVSCTPMAGGCISCPASNRRRTSGSLEIGHSGSELGTVSSRAILTLSLFSQTHLPQWLHQLLRQLHQLLLSWLNQLPLPASFFHLDFEDRNQPQIDVAAYAAYDANSKFGHSNLCISWFQKNMTDFRTLAVEGFGSKCHNLELCSSDIDTVVVLVPGQNITKWLNQLQIRHVQAYPTSFEPTPYAVFDIGCRIELGV